MEEDEGQETFACSVQMQNDEFLYSDFWKEN